MAAAANASQQQTYGMNQELAPPPPPAIIALPRHPETRLTMLQQHHQDEDDGSPALLGFFGKGVLNKWYFGLIFTEDEYVTMKQLAAAHFNRNHRLIQDIFSDSVVPDTRTGKGL